MHRLKVESERIDGKLLEQHANIDKKLAEVEQDVKRTAEKKRSAADEGDLRENAGYHTASENLARLQVELKNLTNKKSAFEKFKGNYESSGFVGIGSTLELTSSEGDRYYVKLVPPDLGDAAIGAVSVNSPIGKKLVGRTKGETVSVQTPTKSIDYTIEDLY